MELSLCLIAVAAILTTLIILPAGGYKLEQNASSIIRLVPVPPVPDPGDKQKQRLRHRAVRAEELPHRLIVRMWMRLHITQIGLGLLI
jgi:hypothetical protein